MSKRIKSDRLKRYATSIGAVGAILGALLLSFLVNSGSVEVGNYSANEYCGGDVICYLELQDTFFKEDVFVYPMDAAELVNARPSDSIISARLYRSWGSGWREIPLETGCTGSWCGCGWCTTNNPSKFAYAFRENRTYTIRLEVEKTPNSTIQWNINPSGTWFPIDHSTSVNYSYHYANKTIQVQKWHEVNTSYDIPVYKDIEIPCNSTNATCFECSNSTGDCTYMQVVDYYDEGWHMVNTSYYADEVVSDERIDAVVGITVCGEYYPAKHVGGIYMYNNTLSRMLVPPGDRNIDEYPDCRPHEVEKNACEMVKFEGGCDE